MEKNVGSCQTCMKQKSIQDRIILNQTSENLEKLNNTENWNFEIHKFLDFFNVQFNLSEFKSSLRRGKFVHSSIAMCIYTFQEEKLDAIIGNENTHRCRIHPHEAAIFSLGAKGKHLDRFSSISRVELTVEVDEKKEDFSVEISVNFSKEDVAKVKIFTLLKILHICIDFNKKRKICLSLVAVAI